MPIGLQIVGFTNEDENVLGIMKVLESKLNYKQEISQPIKNILKAAKDEAEKLKELAAAINELKIV